MKLKNLKWTNTPYEGDDVWRASLNHWRFIVEPSSHSAPFPDPTLEDPAFRPKPVKWFAKIEGTYQDHDYFDDVAKAKAWCVQRCWHIRSRTSPAMDRRLRAARPALG